MSSDQNKLKSFCKYQFKLIDSYVSILEYYKESKNFESELNSLDENEEKDTWTPGIGFYEGQLVEVADRLWAGINKPGGTARIARLNEGIRIVV